MRSKKYKKILIVAGVILFIVSAYFIGLQQKNNSIKLKETSENPATQNSFSQDSPNDSVAENNLESEKTQQSENFSTENTAEKLVSTSLKVQDKNYSAKIKEGSSAYELMNQLKKQGFSFSATEYSSLGFFVTEINGIKEDRKNSTYWTLYLNGKESTVGASQLILKEGDLIEWKYENRKNY